MQNLKTWLLRPEIHNLGIFEQDFEKKYSHVWKKRSQICKNNKKNYGPKNLKIFGTKISII